MIGLELSGDPLGLIESLGRVPLGEGPGQSPVDLRSELFGQMSLDVAAFVQGAALDLSVIAEDLLDPGGERLGPVEHGQQAAVAGQAPGGQIGQQAGHHGLVLGVTQPQPDRNLGPIRGDGQGHHHALAGDLSPSIMITTTSSPDGSRAISSARAASVARLNRRLTELRPVAFAFASTSALSGSATST